MKKILKNKKGFTLVELIVVIAILGVLAVIMVPAFTGYIKKAEDSNVLSQAKSYCTAYQAAYADLVASGSDASSLSDDTINTEAAKLDAVPPVDDKLTSSKVVISTSPTTGTCTVTKTQ